MTTYNASEIDRLVREGTDVYSRNRPGLVTDMVAALSAAKAEVERLTEERDTLALSSIPRDDFSPHAARARSKIRDLSRRVVRLRPWPAEAELHCDAHGYYDGRIGCVGCDRDRLAAESESLKAEAEKRLGAWQASAELGRCIIDRDRLAAEVERLTNERDEARNRVLRPLTEDEVVATLHEGHAKRRIAQGDNAWTSLVNQRDRLAAEVKRLTMGSEGLCDGYLYEQKRADDLSAEVERLTKERDAFAGEATEYAALSEMRADEITRLSARVRELELTEEDREAMAMLRSTIEIKGRYGSKVNRALTLLDRLVKGGR